MKSRTKIGIILISLHSAAIMLAIHWGAFHLITGSLASLSAAISILLCSGEESSVCGRKRIVADFYSRIPGAGHLYMGRRKRSVPFFLSIIVCIFLICLIIFYPSDVIYLMLIIVLTVLYASLMSGTDVERLCDEMGVPHRDPTKEIRADRPYGYHTLTFLFSSAAILLTLYFWLFDWNDDRNIWFYVIISMVWVIAMIISCIRVENKNTGMVTGAVLLYLISLMLMIYWDFLILIIASTGMLLTVLLRLPESDDDNYVSKERASATYFSFLPGAGHLCLGRRKNSVPFFSVMIVLVFIFYLIFLYPSDTVYLAFVFALTLLYTVNIALIDVNRLCDEMGLPHRRSTEIVPVDSYGYHTLTIFISSLIILLTLYYWLFDWNDDRNIWIYAVTGMVWFIIMMASAAGVEKKQRMT